MIQRKKRKLNAETLNYEPTWNQTRYWSSVGVKCIPHHCGTCSTVETDIDIIFGLIVVPINSKHTY